MGFKWAALSNYINVNRNSILLCRKNSIFFMQLAIARKPQKYRLFKIASSGTRFS